LSLVAVTCSDRSLVRDDTDSSRHQTVSPYLKA
jgi:hypothetical protein